MEVRILTFIFQKTLDSAMQYIGWICRREIKDTFQQERNITDHKEAILSSTDSISSIHNIAHIFRFFLTQTDISQGKLDASWSIIAIMLRAGYGTKWLGLDQIPRTVSKGAWEHQELGLQGCLKVQTSSVYRGNSSVDQLEPVHWCRSICQ